VPRPGASLAPEDRDFPELLGSAQRGEAAAWDRIYRWLAPAIAGYLRVQGACEIDDLTSGVFLGMVRGIASFRGDAAAFRSGVFVIAHRRLQDERRRRLRRPEPASLDEHVEDPAGAGDVEREALARLARERVEARCARLAPDQRDVLLLRIVGDLTVDQVASVLDKTPGAVKALQRRGLEALRRDLAGAPREGVSL
jgi:RNA polymerase sigma factor (sigma-70 family)